MRKTALFMILLTLSIPFVVAQELSVNRYRGADASNGYARTNDDVTIETIAQIPGENIISEDQMRIYIGQDFGFFDNCTATGDRGYHNCVLNIPDFEWYEEPFVFTAELRDDDDNIVGSETKTIVVDSIPPRVNMSIDPPVSNGDVTVSYYAEDFGLTHGDISECSGIKEVLVIGGTVSKQDFEEPGKCVKDNVFQLTLEPGTEQVCVTAIDHVNLMSPPYCVDVTIDSAPPEIQSLTIVDNFDSTVELTHVKSGQERQAAVHVVITDDGGVDGSTVRADFSQLNPNFPGFIPMDDITGNIYTWKNIPVTEVDNCQITVKTSDILGNNAEEQFPCDIAADDQGPVVTGIKPDNRRDDTPLYGFNTPLTVEFQDKDNDGNAGIGMHSLNAYMDFSELGMSDYTAADACERTTGSTWRCDWYITPPLQTQEGSFSVTLLQATSDDLGNTISGPETFEIIYDNEGPLPPEIIDFTVVSGEAGLEYQGAAVRGDYVQYTVQSRGFETGYANFTSIGGNEETSYTTCDFNEDGSGTCMFEQLVSLSGPYTADLSFTVADDAGNTASTETSLQVYGIDNETNPVYWQVGNIQCSPSTVGGNTAVVDRKLASIISPYITCRVPLHTSRSDISTLAIAGPTSADDCTGDTTLILSDAYVTNSAEDSSEPYLVYTLEPQDYYENQLNITCPISVISKRSVETDEGTQFYVSPYAQQVDVDMYVKFYNNPLGELYNEQDRQVKDSIDNFFTNANWISDIKQFLAIGEQVCQWKVVLTSVISTIAMVSIALGVSADTLKGIPFMQGAAAALENAKINTCTIEEDLAQGYGEIMEFIDVLCSIVNCATVGGKNLGDAGNYLSGNMDVPWCSDFKEALNDIGAGGIGGGVKEAAGGVSVKDSIILSTLCLCLPGIIHNLEKLRQIHCFKGVCYYDYVRERGYPSSFCEGMYQYHLCQYALGQVFALLPFIQFFDKLIDIVVDMIANPVNLFVVGIGWVCKESCYAPGSTGFAVCSAAKLVATVGEAWGAFAKMEDAGDLMSPVGNQYCDRLEDIRDEIE